MLDVRLQSQDMQRSFYTKISTMNQGGVQRMYEEFVADDETSHKYSSGGKFLPLSVWATQGPSSIDC
jgi:hypothetical protein